MYLNKAVIAVPCIYNSSYKSGLSHIATSKYASLPKPLDSVTVLFSNTLKINSASPSSACAPSSTLSSVYSKRINSLVIVTG